MKRCACAIVVGLAAPAVGGCKSKDEVVMQHSTPSQIAPPSSTDALRRPLRVAWHVPVRGTALAAPVAADGLILVPTIAPGSAGDAGAVEAFDARTGARRWSFDGGTGLPGGVTTSPAVADGLAVFGTGAGTVHAIRASTGEPVWHVALGRGPLAGMTIHDGLVLAVGEGTRLVALELPSGRQRWEVPAGRGAYAAPTVGGTEVYIALEDGTLESTGPGGMRWKLAPRDRRRPRGPRGRRPRGGCHPRWRPARCRRRQRHARVLAPPRSACELGATAPRRHALLRRHRAPARRHGAVRQGATRRAG